MTPEERHKAFREAAEAEMARREAASTEEGVLWAAATQAEQEGDWRKAMSIKAAIAKPK